MKSVYIIPQNTFGITAIALVIQNKTLLVPVVQPGFLKPHALHTPFCWLGWRFWYTHQTKQMLSQTPFPGNKPINPETVAKRCAQTCVWAQTCPWSGHQPLAEIRMTTVSSVLSHRMRNLASVSPFTMWGLGLGMFQMHFGLWAQFCSSLKLHFTF